ncbi:MAG: PAS domain-containing protein, partial [Leptolyngbyaceae bacterium]|nr:PAS domain-containing protein [Leptolyngbyaceae bacterium]
MDTDHLSTEFLHQRSVLPSDAPTPAVQTGHQAHRLRLEWDHAIATISLRIRRSLHLPEILQTSVDEVQQLLGCDRVLIYGFTPDQRGHVTYEAVSSPQWSLLHQGMREAWFEASCFSPYKEGRFLAWADINQADLSPCDVEMLQSLQVKANLVVPIFREDQLWGGVVAHHCTAPYAWSVEQLDGLQQLAVHIGIAVDQALLIEQLQTRNALLESQVQERTELLERTNQDLLEEVYEHRQVTDTVFQQAQFWCQVLDSLFTFVGVLSPEGILLEVNQVPLRVAGLTRGEVLGKPFADTDWWDYDEAVQARIQGAIAQARQGKTVQFEIPVRIKGGDQLMVDVSFIPLRDETGTITHIIYSGTDITERKRTEEILRKSEATNWALIDAVPDFLVRMRQDGVQMNVINQGMVHCVHPDPSLFDQRSVLQVMPLPIAQERIDLAQRAIATQQAQHQEYQFELEGETYYEEARIVPLWEDEVLVVVRDITDRKQAELRLHATKN